MGEKVFSNGPREGQLLGRQKNRGEDLRKRLALVEENSDAIGLYRIGRGLTTLRCNLFYSLLRENFLCFSIETISYCDSCLNSWYK